MLGHWTIGSSAALQTRCPLEARRLLAKWILSARVDSASRHYQIYSPVTTPVSMVNDMSFEKLKVVWWKSRLSTSNFSKSRQWVMGYIKLGGEAYEVNHGHSNEDITYHCRQEPQLRRFLISLYLTLSQDITYRCCDHKWSCAQLEKVFDPTRECAFNNTANYLHRR